jgi:GR25 family glycosyltransferase involved in LPS biosynthesis
MIFIVLLVLVILLISIFYFFSSKKETFRNNNIDKIYVINLKKNQDRLEKFMENAKKANVEVERFDAVYGKELKKDHPDILKYFIKDHGLNPGQIGCALSHIKIWEDAINNNYNNIIIFEDDAVIPEDFLDRFNEAYNELPNDWDILLLGGVKLGGKKYNNLKHILKPKKGSVNLGTSSMLLNIKFINKLLDNLKINKPIDNYIRDNYYYKKEFEIFIVDQTIINIDYNFNSDIGVNVPLKNYTVKTFESFTNDNKFPIDVVYTWAGENNEKTNVRISNFNEIKYSLRSIKMYMPWVNHIYILMNHPKKYPSWMKKTSYITILDHSDLFNDKNITNSNYIETYLCYIPNLSEHFIYFNDDFFITKKVNYTDFFTVDGKAIVSKTTYKNMNINDKKILDFKLPMMSNFYHHIPINIIKSQMISYHKEFSEYIDFIRKIKTRLTLGCDICKKNNLHCPCQQQHYPLAYFMLQNNKAIEYNYNNESSYWTIGKFKSKKNYFKNLNSKIKYLCVNNPVIDNINYENYSTVFDNFNTIMNNYYNIIPPHENQSS